ncbi:MAG: hypothetical protein HYT98_03140 [Candidatus Sungbacteria bacterium]|nr:hypothetical protein [Candidatus Sungbacteria bacterium]
MNVVTIPQKLAQKGDLVVVPRREYEALLRRQPKLIPVIKLTPLEMRAIEKSEKELARGDYVTLDELEHELGSANTKKR